MIHDVMSALPAPLIVTLVGLAVVTESALLFGLVLPGSTLLVALGLATRLGDVALSLALPVAVAAAILGGQLAYLRGRRHRTRGTSATRLHKTVARAENMVARHGVWSLFIAQWIAGLRTFAPRLAGRAGVPYRTFWLTQIPVAALWAVAFVSLGHFAGLAAQQRIGTAATIAGIVVVAVGLIVFAVRRRTAPAPTDAAVPAPAPAARHTRLEPLPGTWPIGPGMCFPW